jgi:hypothetical protein
VTAPDLPGFLLARIAEDEAASREAILKPRGNSETFSGQWLFMSDSDDLLQVGKSPILAKNVWPLAKNHIARHDPARVLAECAALRAIVEYVQGCMENAVSIVAVQGTVHVDQRILRLLAQPYVAHAEFDPSWRV